MDKASVKGKHLDPLLLGLEGQGLHLLDLEASQGQGTPGGFPGRKLVELSEGIKDGGQDYGETDPLA